MRYYLTLLFILAISNCFQAQEQQTKGDILMHESTEQFSIELIKYSSTGSIDLSYSKGDMSLKMGGTIDRILLNLYADEMIKTNEVYDRSIYSLQVESMGKNKIDDILDEIGALVTNSLNIKMSKKVVPSNVWELSVKQPDILLNLKGKGVPAGTAQYLSIKNNKLNVVGDLQFLGEAIAKHYLSDYVYSPLIEGIYLFEIPKNLEEDELHEFLLENYGIGLERNSRDIEYLVFKEKK